MAILNVMFPRERFKSIKEYDQIINKILDFDIKFSILKFNLTEKGVELKIEVPDDKLDPVRKEFIKEAVEIKKSAIEIIEELCIDCGACISLCNTGALYFDEDFKRNYCEEKCVGCRLCVDACPRKAITIG